MTPNAKSPDGFEKPAFSISNTDFVSLRTRFLSKQCRDYSLGPYSGPFLTPRERKAAASHGPLKIVLSWYLQGIGSRTLGEYENVWMLMSDPRTEAAQPLTL